MSDLQRAVQPIFSRYVLCSARAMCAKKQCSEFGLVI